MWPSTRIDEGQRPGCERMGSRMAVWVIVVALLGYELYSCIMTKILVVTIHVQMLLLCLRDRCHEDPEVERGRWILGAC